MIKVKTLLISFAFMCAIVSATGQNNECTLLEKAAKADCNHKTGKAIKALKEFYNHYPEHFLSDEIELKIGNLYRDKKKTDKSILWYSKLINRDKYPEVDEVSQVLCDNLASSCTGFLNQDRLLVLQHEAWLGIFEIAMESHDYSLADKALLNAGRYYRFWYGCGTADLEEDLRLSLLYARYYEAVNQPDSAIRKLLPGVLEAAAFPVPYYEDVVNNTVVLLQKKYSVTTLNEMISSAVDGLYYETLPSNEKDTLRIYYIRLLDVPVKVAPAYLMGHQYDIAAVKKYINESVFVKKLVTPQSPYTK